MLDFISNCKQSIIKYKKQLLTFALVPVFMFRTSLSGFAVDFFYNQEPFGSKIILYADGSSKTQYTSVNSTFNVYHFSNSAFNFSDNLHFIFESSWDLQFDFVDFDYYLYMVVDGETYTGFLPDSVSVSDFDSSGNRIYTDLLSPVFTEYNGRFEAENNFGFSCLAKFPDNFYRPVSSVRFSGSGSISKNIDFSVFCIQVSKGSDAAALNNIVAAINKQTEDILNEGSEYEGITDDINSGNGTLSGFIDDYTEVEQSMYDKFTENQSAVIGNFSGFAWGSLSTAVDWTSDYLNRIYDNSGDFRTMFMYPILAGIALIFIGRQGLTAYVRSRREK